MVGQRDLKKHFEAILGRDLVHGSGGEVVLRETVGLHSRDEGAATSRDIVVTGSSTKRCAKTSLFLVGGLSFVGAAGTAELRLSDFHCGQMGFLEPVIVVATPRIASPVFVTAFPTIIDNGRDIQIALHAWAAGGAPAPNLLVTWLCRGQFVEVIL
jgi:hypothetical protein